MAGYWPSSSFVCLQTETESQSISYMQKRTRLISSQPTSLVNNDLLHGKWALFSCRTQRVIPSWQDSAMLPAHVANHRAGFSSSRLLTELAI